MKIRRLLLPIIALSTFACVAFGATKYTPVLAEETATEEVAPSNEIDWEQMYKDAVAKYEENKNTQVLGVTIGSLVSVLASVLVTFFFNKVGTARIEKLGELSREASLKMKAANEIIDFASDKFNNVVEIAHNMDEQGKEIIAQAKADIEESREVVETIKKELDDVKAKALEERQFFLTLISNAPEMVANGTAEKLNKYFKDRE